MFTGGADIDPTFYHEKRGPCTLTTSARDLREKQLYDYSLSKGKKFLGICRGAQLLCAMAGGRLAQDIKGHAGREHKMLTSEGEEYEMSTLHHQMMIPTAIDHELLAWTEKLSPYYKDGEGKNIEGIEVEPEIVYFPTIKGFGIQGHPEFHEPTDPVIPYLHRLIQERLL